MREPNSHALLALAIQDGQLRSYLASADAAHDDAVVADVRRAVARIDASTEFERHRLAETFAGAGVDPATIDAALSDRPLVVVRADVARHEADRAVVAAERLGYRRLAPTLPGPWRAYRRFYAGCVLVDEERHERRIELSWPAFDVRPRPLARLAVPSPSDFDAVSLPERWWFGYVAVHLARLPLRWWRRRSEPTYLGPFLVTPTTLIAPLLRFADARPGDLVVDLGCGDGRILVAAAEAGCRGRGIESDASLVRRARAAVSHAGVEHLVDIEHGDASTAELGDADVVVMFLPVATLRGLLPHVAEKLRPGARLIVHEQSRLDPTVHPDRSMPIASPDGVTVAHRWDR